MFAGFIGTLKTTHLNAATKKAFYIAAVALLSIALYAEPARCALGPGRGPDPIASFRQDVGGGTPLPTSFVVNFDPFSSYLPVPANPALPTAPNVPGQLYAYTLTWDFGDGSGTFTVGPSTLAANFSAANPGPLSKVVHLYTIEGLFIPRLQIDVTVLTGYYDTSTPPKFIQTGSSGGPSNFVTGQVHSAFVNFPPTWSLLNISSPPTGTLPYQLTINPGNSFDEDGYIVWAAINWGDGSYSLIDKADITLPFKGALPLQHSYTTPGTYTVTLSLIDNGRIPLDPKSGRTTLQSLPPANDAQAALAAIIAFQNYLVQTKALDPGFSSTANPTGYVPKLREDFIQITVPGNLLVLKGSFSVNFQTTTGDAFDSIFDLNVPVASISNALVTINLGTGPTSQVLKPFTTDLKGNFFDKSQGLQFSINPKKRMVRLKIKNTALKAAFQVDNKTVVNSFVDVPITITIAGATGTSALAAKLRFVYNSLAGVSGSGKNPRTENN